MSCRVEAPRRCGALYASMFIAPRQTALSSGRLPLARGVRVIIVAIDPETGDPQIAEPSPDQGRRVDFSGPSS
jgi:hypothetical protein